MYVPLGVLTLLCGLVFGGLASEYLAQKRDRIRYPAPGRLVNLGKRRVHIICTGVRKPGEPLVVLETGMGSWSFYWRLVQPEISKTRRVCAYDPPGFGWSTPRGKPNNPSITARELHEVLQEAGELGPYLLVGHSLGGIFVRQFARLYPEEVYGMVLVDSAHEDQLQRMPWANREAKNIKFMFTFLAILHRLGILRLMGKSLLARFTSVSTPEEKKLFLATLLGSSYFETSREESLFLLEPVKQEERLTTLGDKPLIIIQAGGKPDILPRGYTSERWSEQRRAWDEIQKELMSLSTNSSLVIADKSVHTVQVEQPEIVIGAIEQIFRGYDADKI